LPGNEIDNGRRIGGLVGTVTILGYTIEE